MADIYKDAIAAIDAGIPLIFETDTVCGIAVSPFRVEDPSLIFKIKGRPQEKPLQWLIADAFEIDQYSADVPAYAKLLSNAFWPGPLTLVVKAAETVPSSYRAKDGTIGFRVPADDELAGLMRKTQTPLACTSANLSGQQPVSKIEDLDQKWLSTFDHVIFRQTQIPVVDGSSGSTVIDCTGGSPKILREGSISSSDIAEILTSH